MASEWLECLRRRRRIIPVVGKGVEMKICCVSRTRARVDLNNINNNNKEKNKKKLKLCSIAPQWRQMPKKGNCG